ncbi:hypothetical protein ACFU5M_23515, partial [Nocardia sp. NPDC057455]
MAMDFDDMLRKIKDRQWALADIDWDAPGRETITPELHAKLKPFMADLMWIENVGARGFAAMAKKALMFPRFRGVEMLDFRPRVGWTVASFRTRSESA